MKLGNSLDMNRPTCAGVPTVCLALKVLLLAGRHNAFLRRKHVQLSLNDASKVDVVIVFEFREFTRHSPDTQTGVALARTTLEDCLRLHTAGGNCEVVVRAMSTVMSESCNCTTKPSGPK